MIKPTNGRMVWVNDPAYSDQPLAAIVTYVHSDHRINVCAFAPSGRALPMQDLWLLQAEDANQSPPVPHALSMPYQKAVAAGEIPPVLHAK